MPLRIITSLAAVSALGLGVLMGPTSASAAFVAQSWDFGSDSGKDDASDFTQTATDGSWSLEPGTLRYAQLDAPNANASALTHLPDVPGNDFTIAGEFTLTHSSGASAQRMALILFSPVDNIGASTGSESGSSYLTLQLLDNQARFGIRNELNGSWVADSGQEGWEGATVAGTSYTFTGTAVYDGPDLHLTFTLSDGDHAQSVQGTVSAGAYTDAYFGMGSRANVSVTYDYSTFSVIPEPASLGLVGAGCLLMMARRQRTEPQAYRTTRRSC